MKAIWTKFRALKVWQQLLIVVVIIAIASSASGSSKSSTSSDASSSKSTKTETKKVDDSPAIGSVVADGKFAFKISSVNCGAKSVGSGFTKSTAQGVYCIVGISIKNIGKEAQTVFSSNQKLIDSQGREFKTDDAAMMWDSQSKLWLNEINPGIQVDGKLIFDVATDAKPASIELHDSAFSGGVKVDLTRTATTK